MKHRDGIPWHWVRSGLDHKFTQDGRLLVKVKEGYEEGGIAGDGFESQFTTTSKTWVDTGVLIPAKKGVPFEKRLFSLVKRINKYSGLIQLILEVLKFIRISWQQCNVTLHLKR